MTVTGAAVGHFYRQFSKKNNSKKSGSKKNGDNTVSSKKTDRPDALPAAEAATPSSAAPVPATDVLDPAIVVAPATSSGPLRHSERVSDQPATAAASNPRLRPALAAQIVDAPPWLVADHFVTEHVAHEHVSVVPEPDHADPVAPDDHAASLQPVPATTVCSKCPAAASSCAHVSCARNSSTLLLVIMLEILYRY